MGGGGSGSGSSTSTSDHYDHQSSLLLLLYSTPPYRPSRKQEVREAIPDKCVSVSVVGEGL